MSASADKKRDAIVTGTSDGIGLGITQALLGHGYCVANSRTIRKSRDLRPSSSLILVDGGIGEKQTAIRVVETAMRHFGHVDLLVSSRHLLQSLANEQNGTQLQIRRLK